MAEKTGKQKGRVSAQESMANTEESFVQVRERERRNFRRKITVALKKLKDCMDRNGSKTFIRNQRQELEELGKACREVNDDLCDHYYEDAQTVEQQELQADYSERIDELLDETGKTSGLA